MQSWGVLCEVGVLYEVGCSVQSRGALGTVGEALGKPPLALGQEHSCRDKQDMGLGLSGDNGQERKCVQTLLWMWSMSRASFNSFQQNKGSRSQAFHVCIMWGTREQAGEWGPHHTDGVCVQGLVLRGGCFALAQLLPAAPEDLSGQWDMPALGCGVGSWARAPTFQIYSSSSTCLESSFHWPWGGREWGQRPQKRPGH